MSEDDKYQYYQNHSEWSKWITAELKRVRAENEQLKAKYTCTRCEINLTRPRRYCDSCVSVKADQQKLKGATDEPGELAGRKGGE